MKQTLHGNKFYIDYELEAYTYRYGDAESGDHYAQGWTGLVKIGRRNRKWYIIRKFNSRDWNDKAESPSYLFMACRGEIWYQECPGVLVHKAKRFIDFVAEEMISYDFNDWYNNLHSGNDGSPILLTINWNRVKREEAEKFGFIPYEDGQLALAGNGS